MPDPNESLKNRNGMKRIFVLLLALGALCTLSARTLKCSYRVTVAGSRPECPVVIRDVPGWARSAVVSSEGSRQIPSQLDERLGELVFVADISGARDFRVVYSSAPDKRVFKSRVHAQMWLKNPDKSLRAADTLSSTQNDMYHKLHHHGPAFESEYAAYRIYFDNKQTIDTYGKKRPRLELAETMWYPSDEQLATGYGHDNLRVFGSVGVGTLKGWDAGKRKMVHIADFRRREARILAKGPVRTIVEMRVEGWRYGGREIDMTSRYILYAGHSDVQVENLIEGDSEGLVFTTGVMKMAENRVCRQDGIIVAFGQDYPENDTLKWEKERVGLAVAVPQEQAVSQIDDKTSYLFQLVPDARGHIDYVFDTRWRKSEWLEGRSDAECAEELAESVRAARTAAVVSRIR